MSDPLTAYLRAAFIARPEAVTPVKAAWHGFRDTLPADEAAKWSRSTFLAELVARGYTIGVIGRVAHVVGLSPRHVEWHVVGGRLEAAHA